MEKIDVAILGLGTVGQGVVKILQKNEALWPKKCQAAINIKKVFVRNLQKKREVDLPAGVLTDKWQEIIDDPAIKVVIELMGGIEPARTYILQALEKGKNVVTANKDLLAEHGDELFMACENNAVDLYFEASVGGGIPIINPLKQSLLANNIEKVMGIINGTTNYILTRMAQAGLSFETALKEAQELGYAEADPTSDVEGLDAARKIAILSSIAFHTRVKLADVFVEGITGITPDDITYAREMGYTIKLLGIGSSDGQDVEVRVHPALVPVQHPLASVNDAFNAIFVKGDAVGDTMFFGLGAGQLPTASSVVGDLLEVINNIRTKSTGRRACTCYEGRTITPMGEVMTNYFLRLRVIDRPGVLASIAGVFGNHGVSLASVVQKGSFQDEAELAVITHRVKEKDIQDALKVIKEMSITKAIVSQIRVEGLE
ncbi:MAG TPA: homoserine dehydrogenase [Peptococcaceae bacterium]|jgi:homoserine dehydrogenase|nr:homoserine dehydrogenase [Clostridia bacterium]HOB81264.1 homoserine dehydrogenase [Peptococcaceae bacterium]HPZ72147.1 homoserine dehydrogenase [Peptococcaceae bacterium]HQD53350.1 homoserine dehydrogenase [Peptococcaceae bacterium]